MNENTEKNQTNGSEKGSAMSAETFNKLFRPNAKDKKTVPVLFIATVALALAAVILLTVFLATYFSVIHLRSEDGGISLTDPMHGVTYYLAPLCYEPIAYFPDDTYAKYRDTEYYKIRNADPTDFICTAEMGVFDLYYSSDIVLPSLKDFNANYTRVCQVGNVSIMMRSIEKEATEKIVKHFLTAETVDRSVIMNVETTLSLKMMSDSYEHMYYVISYYKTEDGEHVLYDRTTGRCVLIDEEMAKDISNG